ncbi:MAG: 3-hydroxyacyl-CoA dehydrogenase family protein, partial [Candidatus Limnocylindrales bacterium]
MIAHVARATVLGAGTMGAQIACLLAGAGTRVRLLDLDAAVAARGLERAARLRPSPLFVAADLERIQPGGFDELEAAGAWADWVVEAVVEQPEPKRALFERLDAALAGRAANDWPTVSTNTSGISITGLAVGRSEAFRAAFLGSHFFNPPRYARLLELIPLGTTDPDRIERLEGYARRHLGKATVRAKDTPAFIANRLGVHGLLTALALASELGLGVDEVDELTGPLIGRPKSATFRTLDVVGLDVAVAVADHCHADLPDDPERERFVVPPVLRSMIERGSLGEKAGAGFYRRERGGEVRAIDLETLEYRPRRKLASPALELASLEPDPRRRLAALVAADDRVGRFLWGAVSAGLVYAATVGPAIADDTETVDRAMRWGFGWETGPFETWDALGPVAVAARLRGEGREVPALAAAVADGPGCFHEDGTSMRFADLAPVRVQATPGALDLDARRAAVPGLPSNAAASLVDLGEGILGLELHGKLNIIGTDTIALARRAVELAAAS